MLMFRSTLFNLCMMLATMLFSILLLLSRPFGFSPAWFWGRCWSASIIHLAQWICGIRFRFEGLEHLPDTPCVVLAKHQSAWETIAMPSLIPPFVWVLKRELFHIPVFGWALWALNAIAIRRSNPRAALKQVIAQGQAFIRQGRWIVIFPEGERVAPGTTGNYQSSGIMLAHRAGTGILPMAHNAGLCWPKNSFIKRPGTITVRFLPFIPPQEVTDTPRDKMVERVRDMIEHATKEIGG
ncbi:MAG TPA: lysophospholipid acyltransferase family protein [Mariprofundaceae bacterium]|nr:lysophospholipid acyltransferase family protein [Mariprofundaceae bacterium]